MFILWWFTCLLNLKALLVLSKNDGLRVNLYCIIKKTRRCQAGLFRSRTGLRVIVSGLFDGFALGICVTTETAWTHAKSTRTAPPRPLSPVGRFPQSSLESVIRRGDGEPNRAAL
jgi:hypothetical protein